MSKTLEFALMVGASSLSFDTKHTEQCVIVPISGIQKAINHHTAIHFGWMVKIE